ncbi:PREDICTED: uncharacterized protein LOC109462105 [Branchiostoma belcheri]|uniref:Uncharacterized protein LOC109462105 n=1 Tax=Branchiostoma belcheri TaxID=7741 RepID=A0A6P4Y627_BRABE|nr:PREDICTED: uncharacterized protein LOC109462105 [Branchiostoma belcheri]
MMKASLGIQSAFLCLAMIASAARSEPADTTTTNPGHTPDPAPTRPVVRVNTTSRRLVLGGNNMDVTTEVVTRPYPYGTTQHRKRHTMHSVRSLPRTDLERQLAQNMDRKDSVRNAVGEKLAMPRHVGNTNSTHFVKRTTREPQSLKTTDIPVRNSTFLSSTLARLQSGGVKTSSSICPEFCCFMNVSCHYTYDIHLKPKCGCADAGVADNDTNTCKVPGNSDMNWMSVLERPPQVQGTCMGSVTKRSSDNATGLKLHCHIDQVQDFTYTVLHWNVSPPGGAFPFRPCIMFVYVNNTEPPHYVKTTVDIVIQYFGFGLIFLFIGVIMSSCKNIKA